MSALQTFQAMMAMNTRRAVARAERRHIHVSGSPMVVTGYHLGGDPGAPVALVWSTDPTDEPRCVVVPEPRNRELRFAALAEFGEELVAYLGAFNPGPDGICTDAPQLVVPNALVIDWLGGIVGRFTRSLQIDGGIALSPVVPQAGAHLSYFGDRMVGSSLVLAATDALRQHWQTGQLASEDLDLAALLGWIDPPEGLDGRQAARLGEAQAPAGPSSDPGWDADQLDGLVRAWHNANSHQSRRLVREDLELEILDALRPAIDDCWRALKLLNGLPVAAHVAARWETDIEDWTFRQDRIATGMARFANIPTPIRAASVLRQSEDRTERFRRETAFDDPLVMAEYVTTGEALRGRVLRVDALRQTRNPGSGRTVRRPLVAIDPAMAFSSFPGTIMHLATDPRVKLRLLTSGWDGPVEAEVCGGAATRATLDRLPSAGDDVTLAPFGPLESFRRSRIVDVPWTHRPSDPDGGGDR